MCQSGSTSNEKRKTFEESSSSGQKRSKMNSAENQYSLDINSFELELESLKYTTLEDFVCFFRASIREYPNMTDVIIRSVINSGNLEWILHLYQMGFNFEFINEREFQRIRKNALKAGFIPLLKFLLENENDLGDYVHDPQILAKLKEPKKIELEEIEFIDKLNSFRRVFLRDYTRNNEHYQIVTSRHSVFLDAYEASVEEKISWYCGILKLHITFDGEIGIDHGGLTNEWIELLIESFFKEDSTRIYDRMKLRSYKTNSSSTPRHSKTSTTSKDFTEALFIENSNGVHVPNTNYKECEFEFIGSILGLAFNFDIPSGKEFLPALYRLLAGERIGTDEEDLKILNETAWKNLVSLRDPQVDIEALNLEFDGAPLSRDNVEAFIEQQIKHSTYEIYQGHLKSLKRGFFGVVNSEKFAILKLKHDELRKAMKGGRSLQVNDFKTNVNLKNLTDENTRLWIFEIIEEMSDKERLLLYKFITAKRAVSFNGLNNLLTPISFASAIGADPKYLPVASTCRSALMIPVYPSKDHLGIKLRIAINSCASFDLE